MHEFERYLERIRGNTRGTRVHYLRETRGFLKHVFGETDPDWTQIRPAHVVSASARRDCPLDVAGIPSQRCGPSCVT
ncbi:MAG: site-specific integrase [Acidobacteria bacterium]|nr:site-specific integrase [Acidobacteriota bacterium]